MKPLTFWGLTIGVLKHVVSHGELGEANRVSLVWEIHMLSLTRPELETGFREPHQPSTLRMRD
jgi:hypothetical protein